MSDNGVAVGYLTDTQRRRAQALSVATRMFPTCMSRTQVAIARWIITGRWEPDD